jgi:hypothetical protein
VKRWGLLAVFLLFVWSISSARSRPPEACVSGITVLSANLLMVNPDPAPLA